MICFLRIQLMESLLARFKRASYLTTLYFLYKFLINRRKALFNNGTRASLSCALPSWFTSLDDTFLLRKLVLNVLNTKSIHIVQGNDNYTFNSLEVCCLWNGNNLFFQNRYDFLVIYLVRLCHIKIYLTDGHNPL